MAENRGVWGIDIGLAGLKAVRLVYAEAAKQVLATAFDYVPHPKILSQPDANPEELIALALDTFLSRNSLQGDGVAIGVPGQTALARFIQLPPVEASKVGEIVKYEARQQIPFALEEVIWDYQPLGGGVEESGFMLDAEVGLFAMKRDQVQQHLAPFIDRKIEVDLIQIAPLALYNFLCHDQFGHVPGGNAPAEQEDYTLLLDMGADNTTLLVSNGKKIWNRNVPLGGNHFTRALTKEMKLTFAKAEHLKCNATKSPDPKAVFQALRPVFNDYVAEIQRSIGFFASVNRDAKIGRIIGVGNGFKLAGLQKFLQQNLQMDVERIDSFPSLAGDSVLNAPLFQENLLSFAIPYGLALQGLKITRVYTSLLPPEITTARLIRKKKPWAIATAAVLLLGLATSTMGYSHVWNSVSTDRFGAAETVATDVVKKKGEMKSSYDAAKAKNASYRKELENLMTGGAQRTAWLEVYKAINECLPRDKTLEEQEETDPRLKNRIRLLSITTEKKDDVSEWFKAIPADRLKWLLPEEKAKGPSGPGYIFTLHGRHFHEDPKNPLLAGVPYVESTLLHNLHLWEIDQFDTTKRLPTGVLIPVRKSGMSHAIISESEPEAKVIFYKNGPPGMDTGGGMGMGMGMGMGGSGRSGTGGAIPGMPSGPGGRGAASGIVPGMPYGPSGARKPARGKKAKVVKKEEDDTDDSMEIPQTDFTIQFVWQYKPLDKREAVDPLKPVAAGIAGTPATPLPVIPAVGSPAAGTPATSSPATGAPTATGLQAPSAISAPVPASPTGAVAKPGG